MSNENFLFTSLLYVNHLHLHTPTNCKEHCKCAIVTSNALNDR